MSIALITGASKGIGKAIAKELAIKKIDVLLIARSSELLQQIANDLSETYGIHADHFGIDLSEPHAAEKILAWCNEKKYAVNILVNNAGYGLSGSFEKYTAKEQTEMMQVNMNVPVELCSLFLPMLHQQSKSYILNIASGASYQAVPGLTVYAATKAFVLSFSRGLQYELRNTAISVTALCPGATDTDFPNRAKVGIKAQKAAAKLNMTAEEVAKLAVKAMFSEKTEEVTGLVNKLGVFFAWLLPKKIVEKAAAGIYEL
jgi:hypothetical protein